MPYYHFVVRGPDYTYDDPDGTHFPNHEAAREHGHRVVRELREDGYDPGNAALLNRMGRDRQSTRSRFEQHDKRIYELCNPRRFGNRAPPLTPDAAALRLAPSGLLCCRMAHLGEEEFGLAVSD